MTTRSAPRTGRAYVGVSGWNYSDWSVFYSGCAPGERLARCVRHFDAIEVNGTFYRLQSRETFARWRKQTPADFRFTIKGHRYLTHRLKLTHALESIRIQRDPARGLGDKLAAVVWQLPDNFQCDMARLETFVRALRNWRTTRHAIEFRHRSWFDPEVAACLAADRIAVCQSDAPDWPLWKTVTTDLVYVRLHGHTKLYASRYADSELRTWARRVKRWQRENRDVHVYFDNTARGQAPRDAARLLELIAG
jgi:uncharacterized protein YecE (DUF72 family)